MKKNLTQKTGHFFIWAIFIMACLAPTGYSDSFVDDQAMNALEDFTFGQSASPVDKVMSNDTLHTDFGGDSFVDANLMEALKDFRIGYSDHPEPAEQADSPAFARLLIDNGDSFVDAEVLERLDGFVFLEEMKARTKQVADKRETPSSNVK